MYWSLRMPNVHEKKWFFCVKPPSKAQLRNKLTKSWNELFYLHIELTVSKRFLAKTILQYQNLGRCRERGWSLQPINLPFDYSNGKFFQSHSFSHLKFFETIIRFTVFKTYLLVGQPCCCASSLSFSSVFFYFVGSYRHTSQKHRWNFLRTLAHHWHCHCSHPISTLHFYLRCLSLLCRICRNQESCLCCTTLSRSKQPQQKLWHGWMRFLVYLWDKTSFNVIWQNSRKKENQSPRRNASYPYRST